jgi:hypothetical protein
VKFVQNKVIINIGVLNVQRCKRNYSHGYKISKVHATSNNNSSFWAQPLLFHKRFARNCRTRFYGNEYLGKIYKENKTKIQKGIPTKINFETDKKVRTGDKFYVKYSDSIVYNEREKGPEGIGGILSNIVLAIGPDDKPLKCYQYIFLNYNPGEKYEKDILDKLTLSELRNNSSLPDHPLEIFMITPTSIKTIKFNITKNSKPAIFNIIKNHSSSNMINMALSKKIKIYNQKSYFSGLKMFETDIVNNNGTENNSTENNNRENNATETNITKTNTINIGKKNNLIKKTIVINQTTNIKLNPKSNYNPEIFNSNNNL